MKQDEEVLARWSSLLSPYIIDEEESKELLKRVIDPYLHKTMEPKALEGVYYGGEAMGGAMGGFAPYAGHEAMRAKNLLILSAQ